MTSRGQILVVGLHAILGLTVLVAATTLTALHDPITSTLASLFGIILGLAGAGSAAVSTLGSALNGKATIGPVQLQAFASVLGQAIEHLGHSPPAEYGLHETPPPSPPPPPA